MQITKFNDIIIRKKNNDFTMINEGYSKIQGVSTKLKHNKLKPKIISKLNFP